MLKAAAANRLVLLVSASLHVIGATPPAFVQQPAIAAQAQTLAADQPAVIPVEDQNPEGTPAQPAKPRAPIEPDAEPEVVVYLKDGRQFTGLLAKSSGGADKLVVRIAGVEMPFDVDEVERYRELPPIMERYLDLKAAAGDDAEQVCRVAEWLQSRERYELALSEAQRAIKLDMNNRDAQRLKVVLEEQVRLKLRRGKKGPAVPEPAPKPASNPAPNPAPSPASSPPAAPDKSKSFPMLTPAQIGLIKVYEVDLAHKPRVMIPTQTIERIFDAYQTSPLIPATKDSRDDLMRRPATELLGLMFELRAREFYPEVQVQDQPRSIELFRDNVAKTWLSNSCSTTGCHGGPHGENGRGRLILNNRRVGTEQSVYTNLLILTRFKTARGQGLIDWDAPERSVLLQMGLPRELSITPHPEVHKVDSDVDVWHPTFRTKNDPMYMSCVQWIKTMLQPRQDWPVDYTPTMPLEPAPKTSPAAPSTTPPTTPTSTPTTTPPVKPAVTTPAPKPTEKPVEEPKRR